MAFLGIPGQGEATARRDMYAQQLGAQRSQYARQRALATGRIGQSIGTAMGTTGIAHEAGQVVGDLANAEAAADAQLRAQQVAQEQAQQRQDMDTQRQVFGGLIGGAGQVLGMAVPAFGALNGAAGGAMGASPQQGGAIGSLAQSALGSSPQPQPSPTIGGLGSAGPIGPQQTPQFAAPTGQVETFEERMRRLQLGGGFIGSPTTIGGGR